MESSLKELDYLSGSWQGAGFIADFSDPVATMIFGNMQVVNEEGNTLYWETYRFEMKNNKIFVFPAQMGNENGAYIKDPDPNNHSSEYSHVFKSFIHKDTPIQEIYFKTLRPGLELEMGVRGTSEKGPFEKQWQMVKR